MAFEAVFKDVIGRIKGEDPFEDISVYEAYFEDGHRAAMLAEIPYIGGIVDKALNINHHLELIRKIRPEDFHDIAQELSQDYKLRKTLGKPQKIKSLQDIAGNIPEKWFRLDTGLQFKLLDKVTDDIDKRVQDIEKQLHRIEEKINSIIAQNDESNHKRIRIDSPKSEKGGETA